LATNANAGGQSGRGPGLFTCSATLSPDGKAEAVEAAFDAEIAKIQDSGVSDAEIAKARIQARAAALGVAAGGGRRGGGGGGGLQTALGKANALSQYAVFFNDPDRINTNLDHIQAVTAADVQRVARKYLTKNNRVVVIVQPDGSQDDNGGGL